jgi:lipid II:glycine glycyltransferase (peptidoglycan interpeptide bridge formation enzyme)
MLFSTMQDTNLTPASGRYTVAQKREVSRSQWNSWLENSPGGGHLFQSYEWGEMKRTLNWRPVRLVLEQDGKMVGLGQFLAYNTPLVPGVLMYCAKGPWLPWEDEEAVRAFFGGVISAARSEGAHTVKIEPEVSEQQTKVKGLFSELGLRKFRWDLNYKATMIVDLSPSEEDLLANMKGKTRYNVRLAARKGVRVEEDNSPEAREFFWRMVEHTAERNGFWYRPRDYHLAMWRVLFDAGRARLFFATHEEDRLAAMLIYTLGRKYWYAWGASMDEKRNLMPTYLLQWELMKWAKERGFTHYDLGAVPSPNNLDDEGHPLYGVHKFKEGFGSALVDFVGCWDLPVSPVRAALWDRVEPVYFRLHQRLKGDVYY